MKEKIQFQNLKKEKSEIKNNITERDIKIRKLTFNNSFRRKNSNNFEKFHKINFNSLRNNNQINERPINPNIINEKKMNLLNTQFNKFNLSKSENSHLFPKIKQRISYDNITDQKEIKIKKIPIFNKTSDYFGMKGSIYFNNLNSQFNKIKIVDISKLKSKMNDFDNNNNLKIENKINDKNIFINRLNTLFINRRQNKNEINEDEEIKENDENKSESDNNEPDPRINFEKINSINQSRPQTSYGGLNTRKKNLQTALKNSNYQTNINFFKNKEY